ncbi:MAG: Asp23/Gls24 family envelope stress response protein [Oscillospiraceae bacterium]|nr:Asp23/Gls24 family envelope stress response protein [Oscillospiraceae bacterium]
MADNYITTENEKGKINISEEVIAVMVGAAITEVEGVDGLANTVGNDILDLIGKKSLAKGVKITLTEEHMVIDVLIMVVFGCVITDVASKVQNAVSNAIESMTGVTPIVNVHVSGVSFPKNKQ